MCTVGEGGGGEWMVWQRRNCHQYSTWCLVPRGTILSNYFWNSNICSSEMAPATWLRTGWNDSGLFFCINFRLHLFQGEMTVGDKLQLLSTSSDNDIGWKCRVFSSVARLKTQQRGVLLLAAFNSLSHWRGIKTRAIMAHCPLQCLHRDETRGQEKGWEQGRRIRNTVRPFY